MVNGKGREVRSMTYREKFIQCLESESKSNVAIINFSRGIGAITLWLAHQTFDDDDEPTVYDYIDLISGIKFNGSALILDMQLIRFMLWLMEQPIPEFDEKLGTWCDAPRLIEMFNKYADSSLHPVKEISR